MLPAAARRTAVRPGARGADAKLRGDPGAAQFEIEASPFTLPLRNRLVQSVERQPGVRVL